METRPQDIHAAVKRVRTALASKGLILYQTFYLLQEGRIHAQNGRMWANTPCPIEGNFLVSGEEFERAVDKLPNDKISMLHDTYKQTVVVKGGRFRTTIETLEPTLFPMPPEDGDIVALDMEKFLYALAQLRPFISTNATQPFALSYNFTDGRAAATNNIVLIECVDSGVPPSISFLLPQWVADHILSLDTKMISMTINDSAISFTWEDGTKLHSILGAQQWPDSAVNMLHGFEPLSEEHRVNDDWRRDVLTLRDLGENRIDIHADKICVGRGRSRTELEIQSPVTKQSVWSLNYMIPVLEQATHMDQTDWPKPMRFQWRGIKGLMAGRCK